MAVGYSTNAFVSTDLASWTQVGLGVVSGEAVGWGSSRFLVCGIVYCQSSIDGASWTSATLPGLGTGLHGLAWDGTRWVGVGDGGLILTSP